MCYIGRRRNELKAHQPLVENEKNLGVVLDGELDYRQPIVSRKESLALNGGSDRYHDDPSTQRVCTMGKPARQTMFRRLTQEAITEYVGGVPQLARLPTLVQVNIFNALARNAISLHVSNEWLACDAISPFSLQGPGLGPLSVATTSHEACPESLRPTALQVSVPHHPWIDLLPIPRLRDNIISAILDSNIYDEDSLCYDMVEVSSESDKPCLIVWGEPWDPRGWEASVAFLRKWGWLLKGCPEICESTNNWRVKRGESRLRFGN